MNRKNIDKTKNLKERRQKLKGKIKTHFSC